MWRPYRGARWYTLAAAWILLLGAAYLAAPAAAAATTAADDDGEAAILRKFRSTRPNPDLQHEAEGQGWHPGSTAHHCTWAGVVCNDEKRVTQIFTLAKSYVPDTAVLPPTQNGTGHGTATDTASPLLPELAQLEWLELLNIDVMMPRAVGSLPSEWWLPGAFPKLERMIIVAPLLTDGGLPEVAPGALPSLQELTLKLEGLRATLPANWGNREVLPALKELFVQAQLEGPLPSPWWEGFLTLKQLRLVNARGMPPRCSSTPHALPQGAAEGHVNGGANASTAAAPATPAAAVVDKEDVRATRAEPLLLTMGPQAPHRAVAEPAAAEWAHLPAVWSSGFPSLRRLMLVNLRLGGLIPPAWQSGFPALDWLELRSNQLSGTLPPSITLREPPLNYLSVEDNCLHGPLPEGWARSKIRALVLSGNSLTGPAFPPAWLAPGSLPQLEYYAPAENQGLTGTLPPTLAWPMLQRLEMWDTALEGSIPQAWCRAPFARLLKYLYVGGTGVDPRPPRCTRSAMPHLQIHADRALGYRPAFVGHVGPPTVSTHLLPPPPQQQQRGSVALVAAVVAVVGALAGGVALGWALRRRRRRHRRGGSSTRDQQRQQQAYDRQPLLLSLPRRQARDAGGAADDVLRDGSGDGDLGDGTLGGTAAVPTAVPRPALPFRSARRARLAALLKTAASGGGSGSRGAIELMPLRALPPAVLLHEFAATPSSGGGDGGGSSVGVAAPQQAAAAAATALPPDGGGADLAAAELAAHAELAAGRGQLQGQAATVLEILEVDEGGKSEGKEARRWGLDTTSLLLEAEELQLVVAPDGQLVELGEGAHAVVYLGKLSGAHVAVKVFELGPGTKSKNIWREVAMLRDAAHPHIVPLYGVVLKDQVVLLAMELMRGGTLRAALQHAGKRGLLQWEARGRQVAADVASALHYLHSRGILHGDLSSSNVLLDERLAGFIGDLGMARLVAGSQLTSPGFCLTHAAPEQLLGQQCGLAADVYSLGVLLIELTTGQAVLRRSVWRLPAVPQECSQAVLSLIEQCLALEPEQRPTAAQALEQLQRDMAGG